MEKKYGVKITLPVDDPMRAPHLLGPDWAAEHWFGAADERDAWVEEQRHEHLYSRRGDIPSQLYEKIERD